MKIFTLYYDRFNSATTSKELSKYGLEHYVLCHSQANKFNCIGATGELIETKRPKGIQNNMNYALEQLKENEWGVIMSDDYKNSKILYNGAFKECDIRTPLNELQKTIEKVYKTNIKLIGLNSTGNPFYAQKKYSKYGLVDGRMFAIKKTSFRYHPQINTIPDYYATAYHLKKYGGNLILNYTFADFERYKKGGLGSVDDRLADKRKDVKILLNEFPNNIQLKDKINQPKGTHVIIKK